MVCGGILHSHRILKTVKQLVIFKNLLCYQINFEGKNLCFIFIVKNNSVNNFYAVLIFYGYVVHHHMGLTISLQQHCYI